MSGRRRSVHFTLWTGSSSGSYRSWERVIGAARWIAGDTEAAVRVVDDDSGQMWDVSAAGDVAVHH